VPAAGAAPVAPNGERRPARAEADRAERAEADKAARAAREAENLARLEALCAELGDPARFSSLKNAERKLQHADKVFGGLEPLPGTPPRHELVARFQEARQQLFIRVQELREADDWQRWANVPRLEELIRAARELAAREDDGGDGGFAQALKELQAAWKGVGPVPHKKGQELWQQFKAACDQVYERVKTERARTDAERAENLARKEALCARAEELAQSTDWAETAEELKRLQAEWKKIGPVPRKKADTVWKRFRGACDRFFEARKPHLEETFAEQTENLERKQALCARIEALAEIPAPGPEGTPETAIAWEELAAEIRGLQHEWRSIGPVPRKEFAALGARFRAACDRFFERRKAHHAAEAAARVAALQSLRDEAAALAAAEAGETAEVPEAELAARALALRVTRRQVEGIPDADLAALDELLAAAYERVVSVCPGALAGTELDPEASHRKREKLCERAEELAPPEPEVAAPATSAEEMAERLRAALARNALGGNRAHPGVDPRDQIAELRAQWRQLGPVPGEEGERLRDRFESACRRALAAGQSG
jgi:hypothetical protein